jgi:hypothetical protein
LDDFSAQSPVVLLAQIASGIQILPLFDYRVLLIYFEPFQADERHPYE